MDGVLHALTDIMALTIQVKSGRSLGGGERLGGNIAIHMYNLNQDFGEP